MIIVLGASGFIGSYLIEGLLNEGYDVIATGRRVSALDFYKSKNIQCIELDIANKKDFEKLPHQGVEAVVLLAALLPANLTEDDAFAYVDVNIKGTLNVLEYCRANNIKKIISTTSYADVEGHWKKDNPINADIARSYKLTGDHASYVISKNAATDFILHYNAEYGMQGAIFRFPPVYGVGPHSEIYVDGKAYKSGFQIFLDKAILGEPIEIYGDKHVERDVVYIDDVISAFIRSINSNKAIGVYNISSGVATSLESQVKATIEVFSVGDNKSEIIHRPEKVNNSKSYIFDISKATKDFGYRPLYSNFKDLLIAYKDALNNKQKQSFFGDRIKKG